MTNRLEESFDVVLHLLDRQLIDIDGRLAGNVDDVELIDVDGRLVVTAVLVGTTALFRRLGGRLGDRLVEAHGRLRPTEPDRDVPWRIPIKQVAYVDSAVHLALPRAGILSKGEERLRLGTLTGMPVVDAEGERLGRVIDARVQPNGEDLEVVALLVGRGGPGSYLGYERHEEQGPLLVGSLIRWWHRGTRLIDLSDVDISWATSRATVRRTDRTEGKP